MTNLSRRRRMAKIKFFVCLEKNSKLWVTYLLVTDIIYEIDILYEQYIKEKKYTTVTILCLF